MAIKECLEFDILNLKLKKVGDLLTARSRPGVVTANKYLYVFGGRTDNAILDSIERLSLQEEYGDFTEIQITNQAFLK